MEVTTLVRNALADAGTGWSMGAPGAIAEFVRTADEPAVVTADTAVSFRGGVRVALPAAAVALAYETPVGPADHWNHAVALCVPPAGPAREVLTELGPDRDALRATDRDGVLFDLGLGLAGVDACVRTADPALLARLRAAAGRPLFEPGSAVAGQLVAAAPHRVFTTVCGRVEVYAAIPPPDGRSPDGPHTHLLPDVLARRRTHAPTVPVPDGLVPVAHLYPPHPLTEPTGVRTAFDDSRGMAFERLLSVFGDPGQQSLASTVRAAVLAGRGPEGFSPVSGAPGRAAVAVALRKLVHSGASRELVDRWRSRTPPSDLDPVGDRNG